MRLQWSYSGFAKRVLMSRERLFCVTEGRRLDPVFYDRLLQANAAAMQSGYVVRPIDTIRLPVQSPSAGKAAVLRLHDLLKREGALVQESHLGRHLVVCVVDSDYDRFTGRMSRSPHVIYSEARDVEAEVHVHGDVRMALATALSLTRSEAEALQSSLGDYVAALASLWADWITLGAVASMLRASAGVGIGGPSGVNAPIYGPTDSARVAKIAKQVRSSAGCPINRVRTHEEFVRRRVMASQRRQLHHRLVKGKWLVGFVKHQVEALLKGAPVDLKGFESRFEATMLQTLDYEASWARPYHDRLTALLI